MGTVPWKHLEHQAAKKIPQLAERLLLTHCILGNFSCLSSANFFKINFLKKFLQKCHQNVKQFGP